MGSHMHRQTDTQVRYLVGDVLNCELREASQGNGLLDDGEGCADHGLTCHTGCGSSKDKHKLQADTKAHYINIITLRLNTSTPLHEGSVHEHHYIQIITFDMIMRILVHHHHCSITSTPSYYHHYISMITLTRSIVNVVHAVSWCCHAAISTHRSNSVCTVLCIISNT